MDQVRGTPWRINDGEGEMGPKEKLRTISRALITWEMSWDEVVICLAGMPVYINSGGLKSVKHA